MLLVSKTSLPTKFDMPSSPDHYTKIACKERIQEAIIEEAETDPYKAIRPRQQRFQPSISMHTWEAHISRITCAKGRGDTCNPNAYRGIALESNALKLLT